MQIRRTSLGAAAVLVVLTPEEAAAVRDDLGQIWASKISTVGDQLHSRLLAATDDEPAPASDSTAPECCPDPSYGDYLAHKKRGEDACEGSKAAKRAYDRERYAKNPRKARAPQRAYEARQRAARKQVAA